VRNGTTTEIDTMSHNEIQLTGRRVLVTGAARGLGASFAQALVQAGARVVSGVKVRRLVLEGGRAVGVEGAAVAGPRVDVTARHAVVLAASAIQTPVLLRESGLTRGPVGDNLMAHPGVSVTGRFAQLVNNHLGATQGHEVIGLRHEGIKIEALGFDLSILASRLPGTGRSFATALEGMAHHATWGAAIRAKARGSVRSVGGAPIVRYALTADDLRVVRRGVRVLSELFFAAGAMAVAPGVSGVASALTSMADILAAAASGERVRVAIQPGGVSEIGFTGMRNAARILNPGSEANIVPVNTGSQADKNQAMWDGLADVINGSIQANEQFTQLPEDDRTAMRFVWITARPETLAQAPEAGYGASSRAQLMAYASPATSVTLDGTRAFAFDKEFFLLYNRQMDQGLADEIDAALAAVYAALVRRRMKA